MRLSRRGFFGMTAALTMLPKSSSASQASNTADLFAEPGPYQTVSTTRPAGSDVSGYRIFSRSMPDTQRPHPLLAWGNGSGASPDTYEALLHHLTSWGFVVVAPLSGQTGSGKEIHSAINDMVAANNDESSQWAGWIDPNRIGLVGHSQGATGAINAATRFEPVPGLKTVVPVALPDPRWSTRKQDVYDCGLIATSMLILGGTADDIISPPLSNRNALLALDPERKLPAGMALCRGAGHTEIQGDGGSLRGYLTAWLRLQLAGDSEAEAAFMGPSPEIADDDRFTNVLLRNLTT